MSDSAQKNTTPNTKTHIRLLWAGSSVSNFEGADVTVEVISRKIKNIEQSPSNVLFRTHQYEFVIKPNEEFLKMCGEKKRGYFVDLKLFKKVDQLQGKFQEYNLLGLPVITYSFTEDPINAVWTCVLDWQDSTKTSFKGDFCFKVSVYRKVDDDSFKRVFSKISSSFVIVSKPSVYLNQNKRKSHSDRFQEKPEQPKFLEEIDAPVILKKEKTDDESTSSFRHPLHQPNFIQFPIMTPSPNVFKIEPRLLPKTDPYNVMPKTLIYPSTNKPNDKEEVGKKRPQSKDLEDELLADEDIGHEQPVKKKMKSELALSRAAMKVIEEKNDEKSPVLSPDIRFSQEFKNSQDGGPRSRGLLSLSFSQNSQENLLSPTPTPQNEGEQNWDLPSPSLQASQLYSLNSQGLGTLSQGIDFKLSSSYDSFFFEKLDK
eukprot:gene2655-3852_t